MNPGPLSLFKSILMKFPREFTKMSKFQFISTIYGLRVQTSI